MVVRKICAVCLLPHEEQENLDKRIEEQKIAYNRINMNELWGEFNHLFPKWKDKEGGAASFTRCLKRHIIGGHSLRRVRIKMEQEVKEGRVSFHEYAAKLLDLAMLDLVNRVKDVTPTEVSTIFKTLLDMERFKRELREGKYGEDKKMKRMVDKLIGMPVPIEKPKVAAKTAEAEKMPKKPTVAPTGKDLCPTHGRGRIGNKYACGCPAKTS